MDTERVKERAELLYDEYKRASELATRNNYVTSDRVSQKANAAKRELRAILESEPGNAPALISLARVTLDYGTNWGQRPNRSFSLLVERLFASAVEPGHLAWAHYFDSEIVGRASTDLGRKRKLRRVRECLERALELNPGHPEAAIALYEVACEEADTDTASHDDYDEASEAALAHLETTVEHSPESTGLLHTLAVLSHTRNRKDSNFRVRNEKCAAYHLMGERVRPLDWRSSVSLTEVLCQLCRWRDAAEWAITAEARKAEEYRSIDFRTHEESEGLHGALFHSVLRRVAADAQESPADAEKICYLMLCLKLMGSGELGNSASAIQEAITTHVPGSLQTLTDRAVVRLNADLRSAGANEFVPVSNPYHVEAKPAPKAILLPFSRSRLSH